MKSTGDDEDVVSVELLKVLVPKNGADEADCSENELVWLSRVGCFKSCSVCWRYGEGGVEIKEELLEGDVEDEFDEIDRLGVEHAFESRLCLDPVLKRFDLRKKLPLPNMSPAFGCNAQ